eukprot:CAMPEP_0170620462 /NCGR_PEP_ID=MMETSP0224-20130122/28071_1 /TAXON_ID=285029 /ORGANISM="Togula jolla, Strain CCCM 725" /LENGTH=391 /DNA_ID=CAMNT_0010946637 /DNA_START=91 /DNA_END=1266 /DNA_ORIENTATION=-
MSEALRLILAVLVCLLAASVSASAPSLACGPDTSDLGGKEFLMLLQVEVQRHPKPSAATELYATDKADGLQAPAAPAVDASVELVPINDTVATVDDMIVASNSTVTATLQDPLTAAQGFQAAMVKVASAAKSMQVVIGANTVASVVSMTQKLSASVGPMTLQLQAQLDRLHARMRDLVLQFDAEREQVYGNFAVAFKKVSAVQPSSQALLAYSAASGTELSKDQAATLALRASDAAILLQIGAKEGWPSWPGWLKKIFGGGGSSRCDQARAAIKQANDTVTTVSDMIIGLNSTMCGDVLDAALVTLTDALSQANASFTSVMANTSLPPSMAATVKQAAGKVFSLADGSIQSRIYDQEIKVQEMIAVAHSKVVSLYGVSEGLTVKTDEACVK